MLMLKGNMNFRHGWFLILALLGSVALTTVPLHSQRLSRGYPIIREVAPVFPQAAREANILDPVRLRLEVDEEGNVLDAVVLEGHPLLNELAIRSSKQWKYEPAYLNGLAVPFLTTVTVGFQDTGIPKMDAAVARLLGRLKSGKPANPEEKHFVVDGKAEIRLIFGEDGEEVMTRLAAAGFENAASTQGSKQLNGRMALAKLAGLLNLKFIESISAMPRFVCNGNIQESKIIVSVR
jgi:TonB family protein